jgi:hypothetical protein
LEAQRIRTQHMLESEREKSNTRISMSDTGIFTDKRT